MKGQKTILLVLFSTVIFFQLDAQSFYSYRRDRDFIVSLGTGTTHYFGEMVNPGEWGKTRPNIVAGAEYYVSNRIATRAEFSWFQVSGSDAQANDDRTERNLSFRTTGLELDVTGVVYLSPQGVRFYQRSSLNLYVFAGVGLLYMNPTAVDSLGVRHNLQPLQTENVSYSKFQPVIPFGGGIKIKLDPFFNICVEGNYRQTFTDYIDDASSTRYPDPALLKSDLSRWMSDRRSEIDTEPDNYLIGKRGNPKNKDSYFMVNVKLQYYLPYQVFKKGAQRKLYRSKRKVFYRRR